MVTGTPRMVTDGLVLYLDAANTKSYPGSGTTWTDLSPTAITGSLTNGPTFGSTGNGCIVFDGTNDFVDFGNRSEFAFTNGILSVECWLYVSSSWTAGGQYPNLVSKGANAGWDTNGWSMFIFRDELGPGKYSWGYGARDKAGSLERDAVQIQLASINRNMHFTITTNGTTISLYENAVLKTTSTQTRNPGSTNSNFIIGRDETTRYFPGNIYMVRIYNRALSTTEISQNFEATRERFGV